MGFDTIEINLVFDIFEQPIEWDFQNNYKI